MTALATAATGRRRLASPVLSAVYVVVAALFVSRVAVGELLLNQFMSYSTDGGSMLEKVHPSFYGFMAVSAFTLVAFRVELNAWETRVVRAILLLSGCCLSMLVFAGLRGNAGSAGFLIDSYVMTCFAALMFLFPPAMRAGIGKALLAFFLVSAAVGVVEFATKTRLLPFTEGEPTFRPIGLSSHPLTFGLWCAVCIPLTAATDWTRRTKVMMCSAFYLALAASGARTALLGGSVCVFLLAVAAIRPNVVPQRRFQRRVVVVLAAALAVPLIAAVLYAAGALDRFQGGLADKNAEARVVIYQVFSTLSWTDFLFGPGMPAVTHYATAKLHLVAVESVIVVFVAIFGALWSAIFALVLAYLQWVTLRGASAALVMAVALCFFIGSSNNGLASREPPMLIMTVFTLAFRPPPRQKGPSPRARIDGRRPRVA
ncbi:VpsF family polysaccharide biosynthesis protein [Lichenibacterium dinghuense]|uniref:VpsF family polysaccharide biosynthesis protein n=1 Tax=Lichenibacterium dinghuense TaxID=2895977 RepID=UPI001F22E79A|nr:VpsF family polysaccharide biosynthesis protein [Lichenibacterium sp. 6Y81]